MFGSTRVILVFLMVLQSFQGGKFSLAVAGTVKNFSQFSSSTVLREGTSECGCGGELIRPVRAINKN